MSMRQLTELYRDITIAIWSGEGDLYQFVANNLLPGPVPEKRGSELDQNQEFDRVRR